MSDSGAFTPWVDHVKLHGALWLNASTEQLHLEDITRHFSIESQNDVGGVITHIMNVRQVCYVARNRFRTSNSVDQRAKHQVNNAPCNAPMKSFKKCPKTRRSFTLLTRMLSTPPELIRSSVRTAHWRFWNWNGNWATNGFWCNRCQNSLRKTSCGREWAASLTAPIIRTQFSWSSKHCRSQRKSSCWVNGQSCLVTNGNFHSRSTTSPAQWTF